MQDFSRVDADSRLRPREARPVDSDVKAPQTPIAGCAPGGKRLSIPICLMRTHSYVRPKRPASESTASLVICAPTEASLAGMFS